MSFSLEELSTGSDFLDQVFSDVTKTFVTQTLERNNLIVKSHPQQGNQTEAQIAQGQTGGRVQPTQTANNGVLNSLGLNFGGGSGSTMLYIGIGALVLVAVYVAMKK
jgi:hypothetical protein